MSLLISKLQKAGQVKNTYFFGVMWDKYTPEVEAKLTQDLIGVTNIARGRDLCVVCESNEADRVLLSLNIKRVSLSTFATLWILYSVTSDIYLEAPEHATKVFVRDMEIHTAPRTLDTTVYMPYYMPPQGRATPSRLNLNKPAPSSNSRPDTALILLWAKAGSVPRLMD